MKSILVANWKMNPATWPEARRLFQATKKAAEKAKHVSVVVAPPSVFLRDIKEARPRGRIALAAQNAHFEKGGAFTGEISMVQAKDAGAAHVLVAHAERRALGESDEDARRKVASALALKLSPILCVGEKAREEGGSYFATVREQVRIGLADVPAPQLKRVLIAYEPVWAIGAPAPMTPRDMHEMAIFIRKSAVALKGEAGMSLRILYGGAIDERTAPAMLREGDVHGLLVGRASEHPAKIAALLQAIEEIS